MAVFTSISLTELQPWLKIHFGFQDIISFEAIARGIENTNFFLDTPNNRYVLTIFEKLNAEELPFYLGIMEHLAQAQLPCPNPIRNNQGTLFTSLKNKPAALVSRLEGKLNLTPEPQHCAQVGYYLAKMHQSLATYQPAPNNPRGPHWWSETAPLLYPFLSPLENSLLHSEIEFQTQFHSLLLPRGPIHADLFRDNVLFQKDQLSGLLDFYFAGSDAWIYDLAIVANDWCVNSHGAINPDNLHALLTHYHQIRPVTPEEQRIWPIVLRSAALRFWVSRLYDYHLPRPGELITPHDPQWFHSILLQRRETPQLWPQ